MKRVRLLVSFVVLFAVFATAQVFVAPSFADVSLEEGGEGGGRCDCAILWKMGVLRRTGEVIHCVAEDCWIPMQ
jgi:hypothetical protein